jgi:predicted ArsR family transcriptional regulator
MSAFEEPAQESGGQPPPAPRQSGPPPAPRARQISDAQTMRAFAHPVRMELLELIRREGELTATRAAEALGESPGNMSWHLQTLARYGFVEEAPGGKGRARPWRLVSASNSFTADTDDPVANEAGNALAAQVLARAVQKLHEWQDARPGYEKEWRNAAFLSENLAYLTSAELVQMREQIVELFASYSERAEQRRRPDGALPVHLTAFGHPLPPTPAGN